MKTAIYIEDGSTQLVLTPENDFEKAAIQSISGKAVDAQLFSGSFYDCRGGWVRQKSYFDPSVYENADAGDKSLIIKVEEGQNDV